MTTDTALAEPLHPDPVSNVLKWVLLAVGIGTFALLALATVQTYQRAPPQPDRFETSAGKALFTNEDVVAGKGGFQKADLMDYGSLYGMGSYYGQDYTASVLVRMASLTQNGVAQARYGAEFSALSADQQAAVGSAMRAQLQQVDLTRTEVVVPDALAGAIVTLQGELASSLTTVNRAAGWTPASSLSRQDACTRRIS